MWRADDDSDLNVAVERLGWSGFERSITKVWLAHSNLPHSNPQLALFSGVHGADFSPSK